MGEGGGLRTWLEEDTIHGQMSWNGELDDRGAALLTDLCASDHGREGYLGNGLADYRQATDVFGFTRPATWKCRYLELDGGR